MSTTELATGENDEVLVPEEKPEEKPELRTILRRMSARIGPSTVAVMCWLVAMPVSLYAVRFADLDPLTVRGAVFPIAAGAVGGVVAIALAVRFASHRIVGAIAGLYSAWIGLVLMSALHGTPFGHNELLNWDTVRMSALANRLTTTWGGTDAFVEGLPAEYPLLYPWLIARASEVLGRPTWTLVGDAEVLFISASALAAFLLWRRLVSPPIALAMAAVAPIVFTHGHKSFEILTLAVFVPYLLTTFAGRSRRAGGLHWLPAGVLGGLFVLTYHGYLLFGAIGILAMIVVRLFQPERRKYLLHLLGVLITAFVVCSWYVVPLIYGYLTSPRDVVADTYPNISITENPITLPFLELSPLGLLSLAGLIGLFWYLKREWWAQPLLLLVAGIYLYWGAFMVRLVESGHTGFLVKTPRMITMVLVAAGILTLARIAGPLCRTLRVRPPRSVGVAVLAVLMVFSGITAWQAWTPGDPKGFRDAEPEVRAGQIQVNPALWAHAEPLPDGTRGRFAPDKVQRRALPAERIAREVEARLGKDARPISLSNDMRLYVYELWWAYLQRGDYSANSLMLHTQRYAEVTRLAQLVDPVEFAAESANTRFGSIDVFLLRRVGDQWRFDPDTAFAPEAFRSNAFDIVDDLPSDFVLIIRKPNP